MPPDASRFDYIPIATDEHAAQYVRILAHSFGRAESDSALWVERFDRANCRVLVENDKAVAGLIIIRMGQFFGGRSVPKIGVAAVGTAPEARGRGVATELMRRFVLETHAEGIPIAGLYPATQKLYRGVGFEQSGHKFDLRMPLGSVGIKDFELNVRPFEDADKPRIYAFYTREARQIDGHLDRAPINWDRIERPPPSRIDPARAFVVESDGSGISKRGDIEGYVFLTQVMPPIPNRGKHEIHVHDMIAATPRASRRLWSFLAGYATLAPEMQWYTGPAHPMLAMLPEQPFRMTNQMHWMTRIIDVPRALEARGYLAGLSCVLRLQISDPLVPGNSGAFVMEVREGHAVVSRDRGLGSRAATTLSATINGLAALFTGYLSPAALRSIGMIEGEEDALRTATAIFAGPTPWMPDMY
ncbi:MAG: GNAT family N-acetyltransferase [Pyrinomonadaceae bacterium]|nr:GNAT family N-acetyltransferase [Phycisphaerales bacterium]